MFIQKYLAPCFFLFFAIIGSDLKAQCCASPLWNNDFEGYTTSPNDQFNDSFDGFPASFLVPTGSGQGVTGNTAVPLGINFSDSQSPGNKSTYTGAFYVNTPSNNYLWQRGNSICTSILGISIGTITACNRYKICAQAAGYSPSFLNSTGFVPDGNVTIALEVNFVRFSGGNVKVTKVINIPAVSNYNDIAFQNLEFEVIAPNGTFSQLSSFAMTVNDVNDGVIFDNFSICDLGAATTVDCTVTTCVTPMVSSANTTTSVGTCTSGVPNNNAQIAFTGISNSDKAHILEGSTFGSSITYTTAAYNVSGGSVTFPNLKHNTTYTVRLYNGSNACFSDIQLTTPTIACGGGIPFAFCGSVPTGLTATTCSTTRMLATPTYVNGNPLAGGTSGTGKGIFIFEETNFGENTPAQKSVLTSEVGSVWGMAFKAQNSTLYTSAFLKRHMGLGTGGTGAVYQVLPSAASPTGSLFVDLATLGVNTGANPRVATAGAVNDPNELPANTADPSWDVAAFNLIGKTSLGGLDVSTDGTKMYVMNLQEKELVVLDISGASPTLIGKYPIPNPNCSNGEFRPWAVKCHAGKVYVGVVCSAETSQLASDLKATVMEFDGTNFCNVTSFSLDYPRGIAGGAGGQIIDPAEWKPWTSTWQSVSATFVSEGTTTYPQPILSDIEFDMNGSMVLAFLDRNGHQTGVLNYKPDMSSTQTFLGQTAGDILRIGLVSGVYQLRLLNNDNLYYLIYCF